MSKKKNKKEEPWSRRFGEDENFNNRQYSRSARNTKKQEVAPLYKVLLFLFLALLIIPFATYYWSEKTQGSPEPQTSDQVMINKNETSSKEQEDEDLATDESRREDSSSKASSDSEESSESASSESEESESLAEPESSQAPVEEAEETPVETPEDNSVYANTYTVQAGDNLYRIALNHGMNLEELKEVNGLSSDDAVIGTVLKVK